jgi:hypothetical protein
LIGASSLWAFRSDLSRYRSWESRPSGLIGSIVGAVLVTLAAGAVRGRARA